MRVPFKCEYCGRRYWDERHFKSLLRDNKKPAYYCSKACTLNDPDYDVLKLADQKNRAERARQQAESRKRSHELNERARELKEEYGSSNFRHWLSEKKKERYPKLWQCTCVFYLLSLGSGVLVWSFKPAWYRNSGFNWLLAVPVVFFFIASIYSHIFRKTKVIPRDDVAALHRAFNNICDDERLLQIFVEAIED